MSQCPGVDQSLTAFSEEQICPQCSAVVEVWSDEKLGKCSQCGKQIKKISIEESIIEYAIGFGVSDAKIINTADIEVDTKLAAICRDDKCPNYGLAPSCPPHVMSPEKFKKRLARYQSALVFKFDIPTNVLFGHERYEVLHLLHETTSSLKDFSIAVGYSDAMAIAGGSCKKAFCKNHKSCPVINEAGKCRHPHKACPSMSGLGINFNKITKLMGWESGKTQKNEEPTSNMAGIVLLKREENI